MSAGNWKWWHAQFNLAWRLVAHFVRKLNPFAPRFGKARFLENYVPEGLPPATTEIRDAVHHAGRCTTCGECDRLCPLLLDSAHPDFIGPMRLISSGGRAGPHLVDIRGDLDLMVTETCASCLACVKACPQSIPILSLARHWRSQLKVVDEAQAAVLGSAQQTAQLTDGAS